MAKKQKLDVIARVRVNKKKDTYLVKLACGHKRFTKSKTKQLICQTENCDGSL